MGFFLLILFISLTFYIIIPLSGAFLVRSRWRVFRRNLQHSLFCSGDIRLPEEDGSLGCRRILAELEALEGNDLIWVRSSENRSITVEMRNGSVYFMPPLSMKEKLYPHLLPVPLPAASLENVPWRDVFTLQEGTRMYICGELFYSDGRYTFRSGPDAPLMVLVYNEDPLHLVSRAVWCGRQSNEFWNFMTPGALFSGILLLLILSVYLIQNSGNYLLQFFCSSMALLPALVFLPPGVFLFNLYRRFWDTARRYRSERDLIRLPVNPAGEDSPVSDTSSRVFFSRQPSAWDGRAAGSGKEILLAPESPDVVVSYPEDPSVLAAFCQKRAFLFEALSGIVFSIGLMVNYYVVWMIFNWFI